MSDEDALQLISEQCESYTAQLAEQGTNARFCCSSYQDGDRRFLHIVYNDGKSYDVWNAAGMELMMGFHALRAFWSGMNLQRDYAPLKPRDTGYE